MQLESNTVIGNIGYRKPVGLLGGSFSPPHQGHVHISEVALRMFNLGKIYWVYTKQNPLKQNGPFLGNLGEKIIFSQLLTVQCGSYFEKWQKFSSFLSQLQMALKQAQELQF